MSAPEQDRGCEKCSALREAAEKALAQRDEAWAGVESACDVAVTAACAAVERSRDEAYAERDAARAELDAVKADGDIARAALREALERIANGTLDGQRQSRAVARAAIADPDRAESKWLIKHDAKVALAEDANLTAFVEGKPAASSVEFATALVARDARMRAGALEEIVQVISAKGLETKNISEGFAQGLAKKGTP